MYAGNPLTICLLLHIVLDLETITLLIPLLPIFHYSSLDSWSLSPNDNIILTNQYIAYINNIDKLGQNVYVRDAALAILLF